MGMPFVLYSHESANLVKMLRTGLKAWSLGVNEVMKQINDSPHEGLPAGVIPNEVMLGRIRKMKNSEPPSRRGLVMTINEKTIDCICGTDTADNADINEADANAVELALEMNVEEVQIVAGGDESENEMVPQRLDDHSIRLTSLSSTHLSTHSATNSPTHSISPSRAHRSSLKGKEKAVEVTLPDEEAETDSETAAEAEVEEKEDEEDEEDKDEEDEEENKNTDDEGDEIDEDAMNNTDQEEGPERDKQGLHPNARMTANDTVKALDAAVLQHQIKQREKIQKKYNASHKVVTFKEGEFASLVIPKEDRAPSDNLRMTVKILAIPYYSQHRVQSLYGIIKGLFPTRSLNVVAEQLVPGYTEDFKNAPDKEILLSQAAAEASNVEKVALACNCKKKCTKRCICVKNSKPCSQYCHKSEIDCGNAPDAILELTEAQLVSRTDYVGPLKAPKRKRAATTTSTSKPAAKKATTSRNQPSSATPLTTRAKAKINEPSIDPALTDPTQAAPVNQLTMSRFELFAPLAR